MSGVDLIKITGSLLAPRARGAASIPVTTQHRVSEPRVAAVNLWWRATEKREATGESKRRWLTKRI